jgi:hypothetical protein
LDEVFEVNMGGMEKKQQSKWNGDMDSKFELKPRKSTENLIEFAGRSTFRMQTDF